MSVHVPVGDGASLRAAVLLICGALLLAILALIVAIAFQAAGRISATPRAPNITKLPDRVGTDGVAAPRIIGNPGTWFSDDDYPPAAKRRGEQGRVFVKVSIDRAGRPDRCNVTSSSGYADLDQKTCAIFLARGRFAAARSPAGQPIPSVWRSPAIRWVINDR